MHSNKHIAIILPDTLQCLGLQHLLSEYFPPLDITSYQSAETFISDKNHESFDYYFTCAEIWVNTMDFFLPRKSKTLLILNQQPIINKTASIHQIASNDSLELMIEQIELLFENDTNTIQSGENNKGLSAREIDVLQLIVKGSTNKEIADKLNISLNTVLTHRKNITSKLGIKTVSGLTFYAIMNGYISGDEIEL